MTCANTAEKSGTCAMFAADAPIAEIASATSTPLIPMAMGTSTTEVFYDRS